MVFMPETTVLATGGRFVKIFEVFVNDMAFFVNDVAF